MPPKQQPRRAVASSSEPSFASSAYQTIMSKDNRSVVTAVGLFAVGVTFLHSSWAELLLPA